MDAADHLLGIDPDETTEYSERGVVLTIGVMDRPAWERIESMTSAAFLEAHRRAITAISLKGLDPSERREPDGPTAAEISAALDPDFRTAMADCFEEVARLAVKGHRGLISRTTQQPVPFETEVVRNNRGEYTVVSRNTLRWYRVNGLLPGIYTAVKKLNSLSVLEKKG